MNALNRCALNHWMPMTPHEDDSRTLLIQHDSPGADQEANWLPAPAGSFTLTMRLYSPQPLVLDGSWTPPAVQKAPYHHRTDRQDPRALPTASSGAPMRAAPITICRARRYLSRSSAGPS